MVGDEDPTCFTIESNIITAPSGIILELHAREREVNREALEGVDSNAGGVGSSSFFGLLSLNAGGTCFKDRVHVLKLWNAINVLVGIVEVVVRWMVESLVPEHSFSSCFDGG